MVWLVLREKFWSGIAWVVFDAEQHASLNAATLITDVTSLLLTYHQILNNLCNSTEYRSDQSVNFVVQNGIVQANVVPALTIMSHTGAGLPQLFFATLTLLSGNALQPQHT